MGTQILIILLVNMHQKAVVDTSRNIGGAGGRGEIFNMYAFGVRLRYVNLSNTMLGISNSLFDILL